MGGPKIGPVAGMLRANFSLKILLNTRKNNIKLVFVFYNFTQPLMNTNILFVDKTKRVRSEPRLPQESSIKSHVN